MAKDDRQESQGWSAEALESYQDAARRADLEALHECLVRYGPELLERGVPYVIVAARSRLRDAQRRLQRQASLGEEHDRSSLSPVWEDPYERLRGDRRIAALLDAMAALPLGDALSVWRHAEGHSDEEIAEELNRLDESELAITPVVVRKRRSRALAKLRGALE